MGERFYRQRDKLTMNNQPIPAAQRRPKDYVPTYYAQLERQKQLKLSKKGECYGN